MQIEALVGRKVGQYKNLNVVRLAERLFYILSTPSLHLVRERMASYARSACFNPASVDLSSFSIRIRLFVCEYRLRFYKRTSARPPLSAQWRPRRPRKDLWPAAWKASITNLYLRCNRGNRISQKTQVLQKTSVYIKRGSISVVHG